jgi:hypothetical protein
MVYRKKVVGLKAGVDEVDGIAGSLQSASELCDLVYDSKIYQQCAPKFQKMLVGLLEDCPADPSHHSLGYVQLRLRSGLALANAVDACIEAGDINPEHIRFATFCFRDGYTDLDAPLPDLATQGSRIDRVCRKFGLSALVIPEIEVVRLPGYKHPVVSSPRPGLDFRWQPNPPCEAVRRHKRSAG